MSRLVRGPYTPRERVLTPIGSETKTKQSFRDETDVNNIVRKFANEGIMPRMLDEPQYIDVSAVGDYKSILDTLREAEAMFLQLPDEVRGRFADLEDFAEQLDGLDDEAAAELLGPDRPGSESEPGAAPAAAEGGGENPPAADPEPQPEGDRL